MMQDAGCRMRDNMNNDEKILINNIKFIFIVLFEQYFLTEHSNHNIISFKITFMIDRFNKIF